MKNQTRKFERSKYDVNKKTWHKTHFGELHHGKGRDGVRLVCLAMFVAAEPGHELNYKWVNEISATLDNTEREVLENYIKGRGCMKRIYGVCSKCAMPILTGTAEKEKEKPVEKSISYFKKSMLK